MSQAYNLLTAIGKGDYNAVASLLTKYKSTAFAESQRDQGAYQILRKAIVQKNASLVALVLTKFPEVNFALAFGSPALFEAVLSGQEDTVKLLLDNGSEVRVKCHEYCGCCYWRRDNFTTALHLAAREGHLKIVKLLLRRGADIFDTNSSNETALHASVKHPPVVEYLLSKGARNDVPKINKNTPLHKAVASDCLESVKLLISRGADVNSKDSINQTPLHTAVKNIEISTYLLHQKARINDRDGLGNSPLHRAVFGGSIDVVKLFIEHGASIEAENSNRQRPLHLAIKQKSLDGVKLLIDKGANIDAGTHLLDLAATCAPAIVQYFLEKGIGVSTLKESNHKTLYHAAIEGNLQAVEALFKSGARLQRETLQNDIAQIGRQSTPDVFKFILDLYPDVGFVTVDGRNEPFSIGEVKHLENAALFIHRGVSLKNRFVYKYRCATVLIHAIVEEKFHLAEKILAAGAGINQESRLDDDVMSPLYHALSNTKARSVVWCLQRGADVNSLPAIWQPEELKKKKYHLSMRKLIKHISIVEHQQLEVDRRLLDSIKLHQDFVKLKKDCDEEIVGLAAEKLNGTVTMCDVLVATHDRLATYARDENFAKGLEKKKVYEEKYPIYGKDATANVKKGIERRKLLNRAIAGQCTHVLFASSPQVIAEKILGFLSENEIKMVIDICKSVKT